MQISRLVVWVFSVCMTVLGAGLASGQNYPNKPIRIVTSTAGGGADIVARLIAQGLAISLGPQVLVDNRTGMIAGEVVAKSPPDGYTLLVSGSVLWRLPLMQRNVPYDPVRDFLPISLTNIAPNILTVHPSLPARSVKELVALAKARPGELNYAAGAPGTPNHFAGELFKAMAGIDILGIFYKGTGPALTALIGGEVQFFFASTSAAAPHIKSGRLRALAVTTAQPSELAPGLPTMAAAGLKGYESSIIYGVLAPAATPPALIARLNQEIVRVLRKSDVKEKFFNVGVEVVGSSPEEFAAEISSDMTLTGKVIKDAGIRFD